MTNSLSELYEAHPEYVIKPTNREPVMGRGGTQMVLDMANPKVQDLVFHVVDTLMTKYPEIDYIKWDSNAPVTCSSTTTAAWPRRSTASAPSTPT